MQTVYQKKLAEDVAVTVSTKNNHSREFDTKNSRFFYSDADLLLETEEPSSFIPYMQERTKGSGKLINSLNVPPLK